MFKLEVGYSLTTFCEDLLKKRFPGDINRQEINNNDPDKLNFACPYCGDSTKDSNKKRGHFYLTTNNYKCYNDGCAVLVSAKNFISHFAKKYSLSLPSIEQKVELKPTTGKNRKGSIIEFLINQEVGKKLLVFSDLVYRFALSPCSEARPDSPIGKYIESRKLNKLPVFEQSCYYDSRQDKIYLFNLDLKSGKILGFAIRRINSDWTGPKYDIKTYSELKKNGLIRDLDDEFIQRVNSINNYFNILNINFSQPVSITEGQIDAMFIRNCIATTGVTKGKQLLDNLLIKNNTRILFDNDRAGQEASIELLKKGYSVFLWTTLLSDLRKRNPKDSTILRNEVKDINDLFKYMLTRDTSLNFDTFNQFIDNYFSNSVFDMLSV